ncbi:MAG: methionine--tRNA ligase [Nitrospira sp.]
MHETFYITTPIYYVNDVPHIGHAYTTIAADVLARYHRLLGHDVFFLTGLDEHGQKVQQAAAKAGIDPQTHCDRLAPQFKHLWTKLNISHDAFIRTTDAQHTAIVQQKLQTLFEKTLIYEADYSGWYCTFDERFWTEKDVDGGLCPDCKRPVERLSERNYFFKMGQYQDRLIKHIEAHPGFIRPDSRRNEVLGFLKTQPLGDLSISRPKSRLSWGIELPFNRDYVTYVWFDALVNYISGLDYLPSTPALTTYWPASIHLVGKDILTTHAVYWSTMLMALELPLPRTIFAHGWWTVNGEKMSKSRGNVVDPYAMVDAFGTDAFRYFLLREVPFGQDGDFSLPALIGRLNSDLADGPGNLLSRTLTIVEKSCGGRIPACGTPVIPPLEEKIRQVAETLPARLDAGLHALHFKESLQAVWELLTLCDQYIDQSAPWVLAKQPEDKPKLDTVLATVGEALRIASICLHPFMPTIAGEINRRLGAGTDFSRPLARDTFVWGRLQPGTAITKGAPLIPKIDTKMSTQGATAVTPDTPLTPPPPAIPAGPPLIGIEDFQKIQLKVAKVLQAERVPKSEKLITLQVDLGTERRQIVAGIGKKYGPEELIGRRIVIVANLKPAKLMGVESQGMVLAAGDAEVKELVCLMSDVDPGTKVK